MGHPDRFADRRSRMVDRHIARRGIADPMVLDAMGTVPRERFVEPTMARLAYRDSPLPIGDDQTISQPYIVAIMAEAAELGPEDRVLEVGAGSGYGAAVLGTIAAEVITIERHVGLADRARAVLAELGFENVRVIHGDGSAGYREGAPYDAIVVTAAAPRPPAGLLDQLADGGRLVVPVGETGAQDLVRIRRRGDELVEESLGAVRFVPLIGDEGWSA